MVSAAPGAYQALVPTIFVISAPPFAVRAQMASIPTPPAVTPVAPAQSSPSAAAPAVKAADEKKTFTVNSPFVGTFYRSASPDSAPFADIGSVVKKGSVLCIVEAMKLMNEIEAELPGRLVEVLVQNGQPVEYGEALFRFEPV